MMACDEPCVSTLSASAFAPPARASEINVRRESCWRRSGILSLPQSPRNFLSMWFTLRWPGSRLPWPRDGTISSSGSTSRPVNLGRRRPPRGSPPRQQRDRQALRAREHHSLALQPALRSRQLLSEKLVLRHKRCARTELPHPEPYESAEHRGRVSRSGSPSSRIGAVPESSQDACSTYSARIRGSVPRSYC